MKIYHPIGIAIIIAIAVASVLGTLAYKESAAKIGPNPVIEWVLLQPSPKTLGNAGISVTIQGYNFTPTNNEIHTRGKVLKNGLSAVDGVAVYDPTYRGNERFIGMQPKIIKFELPAGIPCAIGDACPLNVVNFNGTSNTVAFKLY